MCFPVSFAKFLRIPFLTKHLRWLLFTACYLNGVDQMIVPMIFIFLSCREKAHDNKDFHREISKPRRESRITAC